MQLYILLFTILTNKRELISFATHIRGRGMTDDRGDFIITAEELELLSEISEKTEHQAPSLDFDIVTTNGKEDFLLQLREADGLQLVANYGNHRLVFPINLKEGDFSNFVMSFNSPKIFEQGDQIRPWRLLADKTISLVNELGEVLHYQVKDLSTSGISILIDAKEEREFPDLLNHIYLKLPNRERLAITGSQIRRVDDKTVAYRLGESPDDLFLQGLTDYLFERHLAQYPEAYKNSIK